MHTYRVLFLNANTKILKEAYLNAKDLREATTTAIARWLPKDAVTIEVSRDLIRTARTNAIHQNKG